MPVKVVGINFLYKPMEDKEDIRKNIIIIALDSLISTYSNELEDEDSDLDQEEIELIGYIIEEAKSILLEYQKEKIIGRPQWKKV